MIFASVLGGTYQSAPSDFNDAAGGIYKVHKSVTQGTYENCPVSPDAYGTYGMLVVWSTDVVKLQLFVDTRTAPSSRKLWLRGWWNGTWVSIWSYITAVAE